MTVREALSWAKNALEFVSGEDAFVDARELVSLAAGKRVRGAGDTAELTDAQQKTLETAVARRLAHEPLQHILGEWDFMGLTFKVSPDVLIPRQDTETLCEEAERLIKERGYKTLLDICTGSGCIGVSLQKRTGIRTTISDISEKALAVARENAEKLGADCEMEKSDLFSAFGGRKFDLITANPPYIPSETVKTLSEEVKKEPTLALDGGADGLDLYRRIAENFAEHLNEGGALLMEIGFDQGKSVPALFEGAEVRVLKDLAGLDRVVAVLPAKGEKMIVIKQTEKEDLENTRLLWADGNVMKFVGFPNGIESSEEDMLEWFESIAENRPNMDHFSIYEDGAYCGEAFYGINEQTGRAALDIKLFESARGRGIGKRGLMHAMREAFKSGAKLVYVDPNPENERAIRLYEGVGMIRKEMPIELADADYPDFMYYELTREEYEAVGGRSE